MFQRIIPQFTRTVNGVISKNLGRNASSLITKFDTSVASLPMREAVRYTKNNFKVEAQKMSKYVDGQANAFLEFGLKTGDVLAIWMDESMEKHVTMLAAAKIGLEIVDIDASMDNIRAIRETLRIAKSKVIVFDPFTDTSNRLTLLRKAIPEFYHYNDDFGQYFHSKHFPELKYFIQTGFDIQIGCMCYQSCFLMDGENIAAQIAADLDDKTPLYSKITSDGDRINRSKVILHGDVLSSNDTTWTFAQNLAGKKFFEL